MAKQNDIQNQLTNLSPNRQKFIEANRPKETGPFGVFGYYPLYDTIDAAVKNSPTPIESRTGEDTYGYHIHDFDGKEYYMPNGLELGVTRFHGDYDSQIIPETTTPPEQIEEPKEEPTPSPVTERIAEEEETPPPPRRGTGY